MAGRLGGHGGGYLASRRLIEVLRQTGSTNAELAARLASGEAVREGDWLVTDRQTAGKGRQGRIWFDGLGNFMGSSIVALRAGDPASSTLALLAGLAAYETVSPRIPAPHCAILKWPNDILIGEAKLAGILLERVGENVIVGIGVNLARAPAIEGRSTTALTAFGPAPDRDTFAGDLAASFAVELERWRGYGLAPVLSRWQAAAHPEGTALSIGEPDEPALNGRFAGLSDDGALLLRLADGTCRAIQAGEVRLSGQDRN